MKGFYVVFEAARSFAANVLSRNQVLAKEFDRRGALLYIFLPFLLLLFAGCPTQPEHDVNNHPDKPWNQIRFVEKPPPGYSYRLLTGPLNNGESTVSDRGSETTWNFTVYPGSSDTVGIFMRVYDQFASDVTSLSYIWYTPEIADVNVVSSSIGGISGEIVRFITSTDEPIEVISQPDVPYIVEFVIQVDDSVPAGTYDVALQVKHSSDRDRIADYNTTYLTAFCTVTVVEGSQVNPEIILPFDTLVVNPGDELDIDIELKDTDPMTAPISFVTISPFLDYAFSPPSVAPGATSVQLHGVIGTLQPPSHEVLTVIMRDGANLKVADTAVITVAGITLTPSEAVKNKPVDPGATLTYPVKVTRLATTESIDYSVTSISTGIDVDVAFQNTPDGVDVLITPDVSSSSGLHILHIKGVTSSGKHQATAMLYFTIP